MKLFVLFILLSGCTSNFNPNPDELIITNPRLGHGSGMAGFKSIPGAER